MKINPATVKRVKHPAPVPCACPSCNGEVELVHNSRIYGKGFGKWPYAYWCQWCDYYVGTHPETDIPLGTMAGPKLRELRQAAKKKFYCVIKVRSWTKSNGYAWLSNRMELSPVDCHFGMFDEAKCEEADRVCSEALNHE